MPGRGWIIGLAALVVATQAEAEISAARYSDPTDRYTHGILGDAIEHGTLELETVDGRRLRLVLPESRVFEDVAPRLVDVDGDGAPEVVVVETDLSLGARLAVYDEDGMKMATPFIGQKFRWLAPAAIGDLDGDGAVELAYVEMPHLARILRVWRVQRGVLVPVTALPGVTNHRIGEPDIAGGLRDCGNGPEMIVASGDWRSVMSVRLVGRKMETQTLGPHVDRSTFAAAMACEM